MSIKLPDDIQSKLTWLFVLLPGFISITIIGFIFNLGILTDFQIIASCFVLTLVNISIVLMLYNIYTSIFVKKKTKAIYRTKGILIQLNYLSFHNSWCFRRHNSGEGFHFRIFAFFALCRIFK